MVRRVAAVVLTVVVFVVWFGTRSLSGGPSELLCNTSNATFFSADSNGDGSLDISDPVHVLNYLFLGGTAPVCLGEPPTICELCDERFAPASHTHVATDIDCPESMNICDEISALKAQQLPSALGKTFSFFGDWVVPPTDLDMATDRNPESSTFGENLLDTIEVNGFEVGYLTLDLEQAHWITDSYLIMEYEHSGEGGRGGADYLLEASPDGSAWETLNQGIIVSNQTVTASVHDVFLKSVRLFRIQCRTRNTGEGGFRVTGRFKLREFAVRVF